MHPCPARSSLAATILALLCGCEFFIPQPEPLPDPGLDGILGCGEQIDLRAWDQRDDLTVDVALYTSVEVVADFQPGGGPSLRLVASSDTTLRRAVEIWDPVLERRTLPGFRGTGESLVIEAVNRDDAASGTLWIECTDPGELCFNLDDDDGDGAIDCADLHCSRDPSCIDDQSALTEQLVPCSDDYEPLSVPVLSRLDDQRTLYSTTVWSAERPDQEFWGGAEIVLLAAPGASLVRLRFAGPGLVCPGTEGEDVIVCQDPVRVEAADEVELAPTDLPVWLEPEGPSWDGVETWAVCESGSRHLWSGP